MARLQSTIRSIAERALVVMMVCSSTLLADDSVNTDTPPMDSEKTEAAVVQSKVDVSAAVTSTAVSPPPATPAEITAWIAELDDNRYLVRERASQRLLEAGSGALDPLLDTANSERPEPSDRAVWILRRMSSGKERSLRRPALERLTLLQNRPQVAAAARETLLTLRHTEALEDLRQLGGRYSETQGMGLYAHPRVILDQAWRGGDAGLVHLEGLAAVGTVAVVGTDITANGLTQLQKVDGLQDLVLYGTNVKANELEDLQKALPQVKIDYRRGALLGVGSNSADGSPVVATVQVGSSAEAAGIKVGDVIQKFEGNPVPSFKSLTTMIGGHRAGDEVTVEVFRGGQPIEFKLKLGAWQTFE